MNPIAPVSMLGGKGAVVAIAVIAVLVGLVLLSEQKSATQKPKQ
jgi:hypothetical protein